MRLLSVDFDYFFPIPEHDPHFLYDWGHDENYGEFMLNGVWVIRAEPFVRQSLPLPDTTHEEEKFWDRFKLSRDCTLFYADSHVRVMMPEIISGINEIWNFDAHHDSYTPIRRVIHDEKVGCQDWATGAYLSGIKLKTFYPGWASYMADRDKPAIPIRIQVDGGQTFKRVFDRVFVCRSGGWTPTWVEDKFWKFILGCPAAAKVALDNIEQRQFSNDTVKVWVTLQGKLMLTKESEL